MKVFFIYIVSFILFIGNSFVTSHRKIPENLQQCYTNGKRFASVLPLNLQTIVDIIRKVEKITYTSWSMRVLSASLVKRFKVDGVVYSKNLPENEGVLKFSASGPERHRNVIIDRLIASNASLFPETLLTPDEQCTLHFSLSNTIWDQHEEADERLCKSKRSDNYFDAAGTGNTKVCRKEGGVVLTEYGTVALGTVLAGIAAALEPRIVETKRLSKLRVEPDNRSTSVESIFSNERLDATWMATIAGELAEMAVYQGPVYDNEMFIGATGFWDRSMRPRFYVLRAHKNFELTRAEAIGAIDGRQPFSIRFIIAKNLNGWIKKFETLRLSQVLDMYYSDSRGSFNGDINLCGRGEQFLNLTSKRTLYEQTYAAAQLLNYENSIAATSDAALGRMVNRSIYHFDRYASKRLFTEIRCWYRPRKQTRVEVLLAFDGSWTRDYTSDFLGILIEDLNVSMYGSKMGIIHGESGKWLVNVTNSPSNTYRAMNNLSKIKWPSGLKLAEVFNTVLKYLDDAWERILSKNITGHYGQAIVLLVPRLKLTDEETNSALITLSQIKAKHPEVNFIYYINKSQSELIRPFILTDEDRIIETFNIDDISRLLSTVPVTLRPNEYNIDVARKTLQKNDLRVFFETYINPSESITYRLHSQWRHGSKASILKLNGLGYGELKVCCWNQWSNNGKRTESYCKNLSLYGEVSLSDCSTYNTYNDDNSHPDLYVQVKNITTAMKCTEIDCKSPDQVKYTISIDNLQYSSSDKVSSTLKSFLIILFINLII